MAIIKTNKLLFILVPVVVLVVVAIILTGSGDRVDSAKEKKPLVLTPEEMGLLGVEGDTPRDTVATLVGQVNTLRKQVEISQQESEKMRLLNESLAAQNSAVDIRIQDAINREASKVGALGTSDQLGQQGRDLLGSLQQQIDQLNNNQRTEIPIGLGLEGSNGLVWVEPLDGKQSQSLNGSPSVSFPQAFSESSNPFSSESAIAAINDLPATSAGSEEPVYTLPKNSTLMGSVAMTALLGRIPIDGVVNDPYPFKVIIGEENLTANGIDLPEVESAIVSGTASGDWTLSCVRGVVKSMTFVFYDGTIRTVPSEDEDQGGSSQDQSSKTIGWISDPQGLPCVYGERKTNAREFLLTSFILSAAGAASNAFAAGETTTSVDSAGTATSAITGSAGNFVAGQAIGSGVEDVREWVTERFGQTFDAIYVPPGQPVAIHIDTELAIDYETKGRKVRYENTYSSRRLP
jgi:integrating conjugative element protein (TIGR03752 family)